MNRRGRPPRYLDAADRLRAQIRDGQLLPYQWLPTEEVLAAQLDVTRMTVRKALDVLRREGLLSTTRGRGTVVKGPSHLRTVDMDQYRRIVRRVAAGQPPPDMPGYAAEAEIDRVPVEGEDAEALSVPYGTVVLRRRVLVSHLKVPQIWSTNLYPLDVADGTALADPAQAEVGNIDALADAGIRVTAVERSIQARPPQGDERRRLRIADEHVAVAAVRLWMYAEGRVVAVARDIVYPGDQARFVDRMDLSGDWSV